MYSVTTAARSSFSSNEVKPVESFSGSIGKVRTSSVNGGGFRLRVCVERETFADIRVDIGNADQYANSPVRQLFRDFDLIEIARGVVVDGGPEHPSQIDSALHKGGREGVEFGEGFGREGWMEPIVGYGLERGGTQVVRGHRLV